MYYIKRVCNICQSVILCWNGFKSWWEAKLWITQRAKVTICIQTPHQPPTWLPRNTTPTRAYPLTWIAIRECSQASALGELIKLNLPQDTRRDWLMKFPALHSVLNKSWQHIHNHTQWTVIRIWYFYANNNLVIIRRWQWLTRKTSTKRRVLPAKNTLTHTVTNITVKYSGKDISTPQGNKWVSRHVKG